MSQNPLVSSSTSVMVLICFVSRQLRQDIFSVEAKDRADGPVSNFYLVLAVHFEWPYFQNSGQIHISLICFVGVLLSLFLLRSPFLLCESHSLICENCPIPIHVWYPCNVWDKRKFMLYFILCTLFIQGF